MRGLAQSEVAAWKRRGPNFLRGVRVLARRGSEHDAPLSSERPWKRLSPKGDCPSCSAEHLDHRTAQQLVDRVARRGRECARHAHGTRHTAVSRPLPSARERLYGVYNIDRGEVVRLYGRTDGRLSEADDESHARHAHQRGPCICLDDRGVWSRARLPTSRA